MSDRQRAARATRADPLREHGWYEDAEVFAPKPQTAGTITSLLPPLDLVFTGLASDPAPEDCAAGPRLRGGHRDENLRELNALFEVWRADCPLALMLTVPSGRLDSVEKTEDLKSLVAVAEERLRDRQGLLFR